MIISADKTLTPHQLSIFNFSEDDLNHSVKNRIISKNYKKSIQEIQEKHNQHFSIYSSEVISMNSYRLNDIKEENNSEQYMEYDNNKIMNNALKDLYYDYIKPITTDDKEIECDNEYIIYDCIESICDDNNEIMLYNEIKNEDYCNNHLSYYDIINSLCDNDNSIVSYGQLDMFMIESITFISYNQLNIINNEEYNSKEDENRNFKNEIDIINSTITCPVIDIIHDNLLKSIENLKESHQSFEKSLKDNNLLLPNTYSQLFVEVSKYSMESLNLGWNEKIKKIGKGYKKCVGILINYINNLEELMNNNKFNYQKDKKVEKIKSKLYKLMDHNFDNETLTENNRINDIIKETIPDNIKNIDKKLEKYIQDVENIFNIM